MNWSELHPVIQEIGRTSLAVTALVVLVLLVRRPFARRFGAKAAYALWAVPLARFVMPPLPGNWSLAGLLGFGQTQAAPTPIAELIIPDRPVGQASVYEAPPAVAEAPIALQTPDIWASLGGALLSNLPLILTSVWLIGALVWLGRSLRKQDVFQRLIWDDSEPASDAVLLESQRIARQIGLKSLPAIRTSLLCSGPLVTGLKSPVVLLPYWFEEDYTEAEQRDALVHELMHLKRRDLWAFQIARIVAATQWFNPFIHLGLKAFRTDQESACDADVLRQASISPAAYGRTLVKAARLARPSDRRIAAASLTLAHPIKERLIMMQHATPTLRSRLAGTALAGVLGTAAIFATASCMAAQADEKTSRTFVFNSQHNFDDDRQMVLLGDPFAGLEPKLHAIGEMDFGDMDMAFDMDFDFDVMPPMPPMPPELVQDFAELGQSFQFMFEGDGEGGQHMFMMKSGESEADFEARIEAWADKIEARAEAFEIEIEARAEELERRTEAMTEAYEARVEAWAEAHEARAEAWAEKHEAKAEAWAAKIEATFDEEFETEMEAAGEVVERLAEQCEARDASDPTPEIFSATNEASGQEFKAICVNGDRDTLKSDGLVDWVQTRADLTDEEKTAFMDRRSNHEKIKITIGEFDHDQDELDGADKE